MEKRALEIGAQKSSVKYIETATGTAATTDRNGNHPPTQLRPAPVCRSIAPTLIPKQYKGGYLVHARCGEMMRKKDPSSLQLAAAVAAAAVGHTSEQVPVRVCE